MSMSCRDVKYESSSSRQRDVIELIFTCAMVIGLSPVRVLGVAIGCVGDNDDDDDDVADPTEATRRPGSGKSEIVGARQVVAAQQRVHGQKT